MIKRLLLLMCVATLTACPPIQDPPDSHEGWWWIKNTSSSDIIYKSIMASGELIYQRQIGAGEFLSVESFRFFPENYSEPYFEAIYSYEFINYDFTRVDILSTDGTLLRRWERSEKDNPGKQFFDVSSWTSETTIFSSKCKYIRWILEITDEDLE